MSTSGLPWHGPRAPAGALGGMSRSMQWGLLSPSRPTAYATKCSMPCQPKGLCAQPQTATAAHGAPAGVAAGGWVLQGHNSSSAAVPSSAAPATAHLLQAQQALPLLHSHVLLAGMQLCQLGRQEGVACRACRAGGAMRCAARVKGLAGINQSQGSPPERPDFLFLFFMFFF
jgi:hypothetical protein